MKNLLKTGSIARVLTLAGLLRPKASRKRAARLTALVLVAALFVNSLGQDVAGQERPRPASSGLGTKAIVTLSIATVVGIASGIGAGVYFAVRRAHTVKGCVIDDPNGLKLQLQDGKTFVLLGATTNIKADERIKVTGTRKKKIAGLTDEPTFVVEKLDKVYGSCSVAPVTP